MTRRGAAPRPRAAGGAAPLLLLLAACARDPAPAGAGSMLAQVLESHRASLGASQGVIGGLPIAMPDAGAVPDAGEGPVAAAGRAGALARPVVAGSPAAAPREAATLLGQPPESLLRLLGAPALRRREGDAEIWLYDAGSCQLDLVLYPGAGGVRVGWATARAAGTGRVTEAACLGAVARGGRPAAGAGA